MCYCIILLLCNGQPLDGSISWIYNRPQTFIIARLRYSQICILITMTKVQDLRFWRPGIMFACPSLHMARRVIIYNNKRTIPRYSKPIENFYNPMLRVFAISIGYVHVMFALGVPRSHKSLALLDLLLVMHPDIWPCDRWEPIERC